MIYPNNPLFLLSLLGYIYYLTYYTLATKDNILKILPENIGHKISCKIIIACCPKSCQKKNLRWTISVKNGLILQDGLKKKRGYLY